MSGLVLDFDSAVVGSRDGSGMPHGLLVSFNPKGQNAPLIAGSVEIKQNCLTLGYRFTCFASDLEQFAQRVANMHASLSGDARLINQEGNVDILLTVIDQGRGWVGTTVRIEQFSTSPFTDRFQTSWLAFQGFGVEQSALADIVRDIREFLTSNGQVTEHGETPDYRG